MSNATLAWLPSVKAASKLPKMSAPPAFLELQLMLSPTSAPVMLDSIKTSQFVTPALINVLHALLQLSALPALTTPPELSAPTVSATLVSMMQDQPFAKHALFSVEPVHQPLPAPLASPKNKEFSSTVNVFARPVSIKLLTQMVLSHVKHVILLAIHAT